MKTVIRCTAVKSGFCQDALSGVLVGPEENRHWHRTRRNRQKLYETAYCGKMKLI
jgi:hypothetical protein